MPARRPAALSTGTPKEAPAATAEPTPESDATTAEPRSLPAAFEPSKGVTYDPSIPLVQRIARIAADIGIQQTDANVEEGRVRFAYYSAKAVYGWWADRLHLWNVLVVPTGVENLSVTLRETRSGGQAVLVTGWVKFRIINGDDTSDFIDGGAMGQGDDPGDKGAGKLMTYALKAFFLAVGLNAAEQDNEEDADRQYDDYDRGGSTRRGRRRDYDEDRRRDYDDDRDRRRSSRDDDRGRDDGGDYGTDREGDARGRGRRVEVGDSAIEGIQRGGRSAHTTEAQLKAIRDHAREANLGINGIARIVDEVLGDRIELPDGEDAGPALAAYFNRISSEDAGKVISRLRELGEERR